MAPIDKKKRGMKKRAPKKQGPNSEMKLQSQRFKRDTLGLLAHMQIGQGGGVPDAILTLVDDVGDSKTKRLANKSSPSKAGKVANGRKKVGDFSRKIVVAMQKFLTKLVRQFADKAAEYALNEMVGQIEQTVYFLLGGVLEEVKGFVSGGFDVFKNIKQAVVSAQRYLATNGIAEHINDGYPTHTVEAVRALILKSTFEGLGKLLQQCLEVGLEVAIPCVAPVVAAVKSIMSFLVRTFMRFRLVYNTRVIFKEARTAWHDRRLNSKDSKWDRSIDQWFDAWFPSVLLRAPLLACYLLGTNASGSIYAFLSPFGIDGHKKTHNELVYPHRQYQALREFAWTTTAAHPIKMIGYGKEGKKGERFMYTWANDCMIAALNHGVVRVQLPPIRL
ncbi:expressed unknown protein [Seminavis robusta]|uniref:Uncharacterized protein n=1 Tax=Seminavis robusta TaxID=568900 RepID=A0A9N8EXL5_9STRA|nr:expressed unknown protein [Seminavis robusta]CAB9529835.1 expressed unknown protein [Seminavis robusta]|eukprot:Sro2004_g310460.1 n/a (389) ;mRNA; r:17689-18930